MPKLKFFPHCTEYPPQYWCYPPLYWCYPPACTDVIPQCTEYPPQYWSYPPQYWCYPPMYWTTSTVLKVSPNNTEAIPPHVLLLSPHSTEGIPPQYGCYPPQYWCYPPACTDVIPPLYWTTCTVLKLSLHCTEQPPQYWSYPPQYWLLSPDVLNNLQCTEQPPQYWTDVICGGSIELALFLGGGVTLLSSLCCSLSPSHRAFWAAWKFFEYLWFVYLWYWLLCFLLKLYSLDYLIKALLALSGVCILF